MYKITEQICAYLMDSSKDMKVPGLVADQLKPYIAQNEKAIGVINPFLVLGSHCDFIIELDSTKFKDPSIKHISRGFYLYRREELPTPDDDILVERNNIDMYSQSENKLDITDCTIELPEEKDKARAPMIVSLDMLFKLLPEIKECLDPDREKLLRIEHKL